MEDEIKTIVKSFVRVPVPRTMRCCFFTGVISGIIIHLYMLTNKLPNGDDLINVDGYGVGSEFGRWFLKYIHTTGSRWSVPALNGLIAIILLSLAACLVVASLEIKSELLSALVALIMISYPSVACTMSYMFLVDMFAFSVFLSCLSAYLFGKCKGGGYACICLVISLGIYQAYICITAVLIIMKFVLDLFQIDQIEQIDLKKLFNKYVRVAVLFFASVLLYIVITKLRFPNLSDYNGISQIGKINFLELPKLIAKTYLNVFGFFLFKPASFTNIFMQGLNIFCCLWIIISSLFIMLRKKIEKSAWYLLIGLLFILFPLALGGTYIMAPDAAQSMLMFYQYSLVYVFLIAITENLINKSFSITLKSNIKKGKVICLCCTMLLIIYQNYVLTNEAYFRMDIGYQRAYALCNRIMVKLEATPQYQYGDMVALVGYVPENFGTFDIDNDRFQDMSGIANERGMVSQTVRNGFMRIYIGVYMPELGWGFENKYWEMEEYKNMPLYPAEGCIKRIDGIWVVKLG